MTLKKYPFDKFSIEDFKSAFRFLGLPKAALSRYLDANRIAMALKTYASKHITTNYTPGDEDAVASASLTGSHAMSVLAPLFPQAALEIPFDFILGQMPRGNEHTSILIDDDNAAAESVIDIKSIIDAMTVPLCFGRKVVIGTSPDSTPEHSQKLKIAPSPNPNFTPLSQDSLEGVSGGDLAWSINNFASELLVELSETSHSSDNHSLSNLAHLLTSLLVQMRELSNQFNAFDNKIRREKLFGILRQCLAVKVCDCALTLHSCVLSLLTKITNFVRGIRAMVKIISQIFNSQMAFRLQVLLRNGAKHVRGFTREQFQSSE